MNKQKIKVNNSVLYKSKTIEVRGDIIVPDIKPDIISIINTNGNSYISKKEISNGKVRFDGNLDTRIIYLSDSGETRSISTTLSFLETIEDENIKEDIAYVMHPQNYIVDFWDNLKKNKFIVDDKFISDICLKSKFIFNTRNEYIKKLKMENMYELFANIEMPLTEVLASMEINGVKVNREVLANMKDDIKAKLDIMTNSIYNLAGCEFNINSPKQLGEILFDKLGLPFKKTNKSGSYKTDATTLHKLINNHPIIEKLLEIPVKTS